MRGQQPSLDLALRQALRAQYQAHPRWSYQLHADNLAVLARENPGLGPMPSYATVRRFMKTQGLVPRRRGPSRSTPGADRTAARLEQREVRSFEAEYVHLRVPGERERPDRSNVNTQIGAT
jgi:hypothetical protein